MLKINKGLHKKKKKNKKNKHKDEEDFDKEELEKYRREHQGEASQAASGSDAWKSFQLLTSGVDDILKKTQDDLDRIKSSSFFQRKPPGVVDLTKDKDSEPEKTDSQEYKEDPENKTTEPKPLGLVEVSDAEDDAGGDSDPDDIFDTAYVDVAVAGDLKLAYIPDSPVDKFNPGEPDPFDTSIVDKILPAEVAKRSLFSLGSAVDVLTGKADPKSAVNLTEEEKKQHRKRIFKPVNLLLESFDTDLSCGNVVTESVPEKTLLDDDSIFDTNLEFVPPATELVQPSKKPAKPDIDEELKGNNAQDILNEFDLINTTQIEDNLTLVTKKPDSDDELDDEFAALAADSLKRDVQNVANDEISDDPFDTTFVENLIPGKFELKLIENEILNAQIDDQDVVNNKKVIFDGNNLQFANIKIKINANSVSSIEDVENLDHSDITRPLSFQHRDLLGGSTTDLSKIGHDPLEPKKNSEPEEIKYKDPFDVSAVEKLTAPGQVELKFLEKELLESNTNTLGQLDDDDFDPRAQETIKTDIKRPDQLFTQSTKRASVPKIVAFQVGSPTNRPDLLAAVDQEEDSKVNKPLTPYYPDPKDLPERNSFESDIVDPFDTSHLSHVPGKCELKLLEEELKLYENTPKNSFSSKEDELQKVKAIPPTTLPIKLPPQVASDILTADEHIDIKLHTPVVPEKPSLVQDSKTTNIDPFDTSIADNILPGKVELKLLENELISNADQEFTGVSRSYTDPDFNPRPQGVEAVTIVSAPVIPVNIDQVLSESISEVDEIHKPLTPTTAETCIDTDTYVDPFDTSSIEIGPTKTELKLIESELFKN